MSSVSQAQPQGRPSHQPPAPAGVSMRDLLASCAAATAVSTPPRAPEPEARGQVRDRQSRPDQQSRQDRQSHREAA